MRRRAGPAGVLAVGMCLTALIGLTGCGFFDRGADARKAAEAFAAALEAGDVAKVPFTSTEAPAQYDDQRGVLADVPTEVTVGQVTRSGDSATVTLDWVQQVEGHEWKHSTEATLVDRDGAWRVEWTPAILLDELTDTSQVRIVRTAAERGTITGRDDEPLVVPRPVLRVGIDKTGLTTQQAVAAARVVGRAVDVGVKDFVTRVRAAGDKAFVEAIVLRAGDVGAPLRRVLENTKGARGIEDELPLAPSRRFAAALLGRVGAATAELIEDSGGRLEAGDETGLSGLQRRYDELLGGTPGVTVSVVPAEEDAQAETVFEVDPEPGRPLALTLDRRLQQRAERELADVRPASALVAIQPSTGAVLAAANGPGSDGYDTATFGQYPPGSTFKPVSALALLRAGLEPGSTITCPDQVVVDGKRFENYDGYPPGKVGRITLREALANSCNTAFISERNRIEPGALAEAAAALGFGVDHDVGFPAYFGQVPSPASRTEAAADLIGQGKVLASPLAMATIVASIVRSGTVVPYLVDPALLEGGELPVAEPTNPLTGAEAAALQAMMKAVVTEGSGIRLRDLAPPDVLAKTGTAEYGDDDPPATHAWMVGAQGDLAVAVFVATGDSGSGTAGPILEDFLRFAGQLDRRGSQGVSPR